MRQFSAIAARTANSTALAFKTGSAPGNPRHTGHTFVFGGSPKRVEHPQKIFVAVSSWTWTSSPITGSYFANTSRADALMVAMERLYGVRYVACVRSAALGAPLLRGIFSSSCLFQRKVKVEELLPVPIAETADIHMAAIERS